MRVTREQAIELLKADFGDVEPMHDEWTLVGCQSLVPLGMLGTFYVYQDKAGKRSAVPVPFGKPRLGVAA
jgi:hypothetical protein